MRLFVAIDLPENVKEKLRKLQNELKELGNFSFVKDFHLTLKFLGEVSEDKIEEIKEKLQNIKVNSFDLILNDLGVFPDEGYIRVIWVGCSNKEVFELHEKIDDSLKDLFGKDNRFSGHITLARVKFVKDRENLKKKLNIKFSSSFKVDNFKLIKSELTRNGAVYSILEEFS